MIKSIIRFRRLRYIWEKKRKYEITETKPISEIVVVSLGDIKCLISYHFIRSFHNLRKCDESDNKNGGTYRWWPEVRKNTCLSESTAASSLRSYLRDQAAPTNRLTSSTIRLCYAVPLIVSNLHFLIPCIFSCLLSKSESIKFSLIELPFHCFISEKYFTLLNQLIFTY